MNINATFLQEEQIWGDKALWVIKEYGTKTGFSDLAIALGGLMGSSYKTSDGQRTGYVWSASPLGDGGVRAVRSGGGTVRSEPQRRLVGARPALPPSSTSLIRPSAARPNRKIGKIEVVEFGEYPQTIASKRTKGELEKGLSNGSLAPTGKKYTFDGEAYNAYDKPFRPENYPEYEYRGKKHIRVVARPRDGDSVFSNGHLAKQGEICWIEVLPIEWLADPTGWWVARQCLFSGVQFDRNLDYRGNFDGTDMNNYLINYFSKEMLTAQMQADRYADNAQELIQIAFRLIEIAGGVEKGGGTAAFAELAKLIRERER